MCGLVQNTHINGIGYGIIDKFAENQTVAGLIEKLHCVRRDRDASANIWIAFEDLWRSTTSLSVCQLQTLYTHPVNVVRKLSSLILVDSMADIRVGALNSDPTSLGGDRGSPRAEFDIELSDGRLVTGG